MTIAMKLAAQNEIPRAIVVTFLRQACAILLIVGMNLSASLAVAETGIDVVIEANPKLQDLKGLEGVVAVNSLAIKSNPLLTNLNPLKNLEQVIGALDVQTNTALSDCKALAPVLDWPSGADKDVGSANISGNATGCLTEAEVLLSVVGPTPPVIVSESFSLPTGSASDDIINMSLDFTPSIAREAIFPVTGHRATCRSTDFVASGPLAIPLLDGAPVSPMLEMRGSAGSNASSFVAEIEVGVDITHTDPVDLLVTLKNPEGIPLLLWDRSSPNAENLIGIFPNSLSPAEPLSALAQDRVGGEWTLVVEDVGVGPIIREGTLNGWSLQISEESVSDGAVVPPITIRGVGHSIPYTCTLTALSRLGAIPDSPIYSSATVPRLPAQPSITSTNYDDSAVFLYVAVNNTGGTPITRYDATCTDGSNIFTGSGTNSRIVVRGLTNGNAYTCSVTVTNALGTSVASGVTAQIVPQEFEDLGGLPIWLLYQATQ